MLNTDRCSRPASSGSVYQVRAGAGHAGTGEADNDFGDFFSSMFAGGGSGGFRSARDEPRARKGSDAEIELPVFLGETLE